MITVSSQVKDILFQDDVALQALQAGILNLSAYAEKIQTAVEETTFKPVKKGTIVAALARIDDEVRERTTLRPRVVLDDLTTRSPLCDVTFNKIAETRARLAELYATLNLSENAFSTVTQSMSEITVIAPQSQLQTILDHFKVEPKAVFTDQVGVTVRFDERYLDVPNTLYVLQAALAVHHINFIEIISTYTEFSFIIDKKYLEVATQALRKFF